MKIISQSLNLKILRQVHFALAEVCIIKGDTMRLGIGIDTGGTYTDIVVYDYEKKEIITKGKTLTTKDNLSVGIKNALDLVPENLLKQAVLLSMSTTLATNACVEKKGARAKLIIMGTTKETMHWIDAKNKYGLDYDDVLCVELNSGASGSTVLHPEWQEIMEQNGAWLNEAQALAMAELNAMQNGAVCEEKAQIEFAKKYDVPFVKSSEFAQDLNVMERGATALLNARLLPVSEDFMQSVKKALLQKGLSIKTMVVRSDGSLMTDVAAHTKPVETILSGPAASVIGALSLAKCANSVVVDIGGTTTDVSIVENYSPCMTDGIKIGGWRTQINGVYIDTFGLGGDSRIFCKEASVQLDTRRVQPLCALSIQHPNILNSLKHLAEGKVKSNAPLHEFLYIVRAPKNLDTYSEYEKNLISKLEKSPVMLGDGVIDLYNLKTERLENEGIIMRAGLTPTDIMHIKGDFCAYNKDASIFGVRFLLRNLYGFEDSQQDLQRFCDMVYDKVGEKLYKNLARIMLTHSHKKIFTKPMSKQLLKLVQHNWKSRNDENYNLINFNFTTPATLIGIGAPTHIFLPEVAKAFGCEFIIPKHAEVANAFGAIVADISATSKVTITPCYPGDEFVGYKVYSSSGLSVHELREDAVEFAQKKAREQAEKEARALGAIGQVEVTVNLKSKTGTTNEGSIVELGDTVTATACGRISGD